MVDTPSSPRLRGCHGGVTSIAPGGRSSRAVAGPLRVQYGQRFLDSRAVVFAAAAAATLLFLSEVLHLTLGNRAFLNDVGPAQLGLTLLIYASVAAGVSGAACLASQRAPVRLLIVSVFLYCVVALKLLYLNAVFLKSAALLVGFSVASSVAYALVLVIVIKFVLNPLLILVVPLGFLHGFRWASREWATRGGDMLRYLAEPSTLLSVGGIALALACTAWLSKRRRGLVQGAAVAFLLLVLSILGNATSRAKAASLLSEPSAGAGDIYIVSIDALRKDVFDRACDDPALKPFCDSSVLYENVVAEGLGTYEILAKNIGSQGDDCRKSLPEAFRKRGSVTKMYFGRKSAKVDGHHCFDYYYSGSAADRRAQFAIPAAYEWLISNAAESARSKFIPSELLLGHMFDTTPEAPFFAYIHLLDLHAPYVPVSRVNDEQYLRDLDRFMSSCYLSRCDLESVAGRDLIAKVRKAYDETVPEVIAHINTVLKFARSRNRPFQVIVTADHGELFGEHGGIAHAGGFVPELLFVPFAVYSSLEGAPKGRNCTPMLSSTAFRSALLGEEPLPSSALQLSARKFGQATLDFARGAIEYSLVASMDSQRGTWRNVHDERSGSVSFAPARCDN